MTRCQQDEVYAAQDALGRGIVFTSLNEADAYLEGMLADSWWETRFPRVKDIELHAHTGRWGGLGTWYEDTWTGHVELHSDSRDERTLIHEVAHVCARAEHDHRAHGPAFVGIYLELVFRLMGTEAWTTLRDSMLANGVEW